MSNICLTINALKLRCGKWQYLKKYLKTYALQRDAEEKEDRFDREEDGWRDGRLGKRLQIIFVLELRVVTMELT